MIIGEAPGAEEDKAGLCFVGRAGKMLDKVMAEAGIDTNRDTLIANVMKCRPPGNRIPLRDEVEKCLPALWRQVELLRPAILVLLGRTALKHVVPNPPKLPMEELVGKICSLKHGAAEIPYLVLYHPAYLLYDPRKRDAMAEHVQVLKDFVVAERLI